MEVDFDTVFFFPLEDIRKEFYDDIMEKNISRLTPVNLTQPRLNMLRNQLDYTRVPFSDRGSRLMVFKTA